MKKRITIIVSLLAVFIIGSLCWKYWEYRQEQEEMDRMFAAAEAEKALYADQSGFEDRPVSEDPTFLQWDELSWRGPDASDDRIKEIIKKDILPTVYEVNLYEIRSILYFTNPVYFMRIYNRGTIEHNAPGRLFMNNIMSYCAGNNDLLLSMYARFRHVLFDIISPKQFRELKIDQAIIDLNRAFCYYEDDGGELDTRLLRKTYNDLCNNEIEVEFPLLSEEIDEEDVCDMENNFWAYSFWARRYNENNIDAVRTILNDLWAHYMEEEEVVINENCIHNDVLPTDKDENYIYQKEHDGKPYYAYAYDRYGKRTGRWLYYDEDGIKEECLMEDDMMKEHTEYYHKRVYRKSSFENGQVSSSLFYGEDGELNKTIRYEWSEGKVTEYIKSWSNAAKDTVIRQTVNKLAEGPYIVKYSNGNLKIKGSYLNDQAHGEYKTYYPDGRLHEEMYYDKGRHSDTYTLYYPTGEIKEKATFANGVLEGDYFFYEKNGEMKVVQYKNGKKIASNP